MLPDIAVCRELATALRAGDDSAAAGLAARAGIPRWLLTHLELGPRGRLDVGDAREALACISGLAAGRAFTLVPWLAKPTVIDLVAEAVETAVVPGTTQRTCRRSRRRMPAAAGWQASTAASRAMTA